MTDSARFFAQFVPYVRRFGECRADPKRDPYHGQKERPWWPMAYFIGDDILAAWVYRVRHRDRCEVGLFLAEDHHLFVRGSGLKGGLIFLLTQTFHLTGKMEVHFVGPRPGQSPTIETGYEPEVPRAIRELAGALGVEIAGRHGIADLEGRQLYTRLTGFTEETAARFRRCGIDLTRACFAINRDVWSFEHVEYLLEHAPAPERLFEGGLSPLHRLAHQRDLLVLRTALLEERFRILLENFSDGDGPKRFDARWVTGTRRRYTCDRDLGLRAHDGRAVRLKAGEPFEVYVLPRSAQEYVAFRAEDASHAPGAPRLIAATRDIEWTGPTPAGATGAHYLPIHDTLAELDAEIDLRLAQTVSTRGELSERQQ